jgi:hypothetical protein
MNCPCGSGLKTRRVNGGVAWCSACQRPRRMHGKQRRADVDAPRDAITRQARARRAIEERRDMEAANAL